MDRFFQNINKISSENIISISEFQQQTKSKDLNLEQERYTYYKKQIEQESKETIQELKLHIQNTIEDKQIEQYVFKLLTEIENIKGEIISKLDTNERTKIFKKPIKYTDSDIQKLAFQNLDNIQAFIEVNYSHYINISSSISYTGRLKATQEFKTIIQELSDKFKQTSSSLEKILLAFFAKITDRITDDNIQYKEFIYYKKTLTELRSKNVNSDNLEHKLISLNLNSVAFFNYLTNKITAEIDIENNNVHKVDTLKYYVKFFTQKQIATKLSYNYSVPNIKEQVINWLLAEVEYYYSKIKLFEKNINYEDIIDSGEHEDKIEFSLSVPQISYFFKIMYDVGIINNNNQHEIFRVLSKSLKTQNTENISIGSLSSKYYSVDESTKKIVKDIVFQMLNYTNK